MQENESRVEIIKMFLARHSLTVAGVAAALVLVMSMVSLLISRLDGRNDTTGAPPNIERYVDEEAGVVCWYLHTGSGGVGLSCLPIDETTLGSE